MSIIDPNINGELDHKEGRREAELVALREAIDAGDSSGVAQGDPFARIREIFKRSQRNIGRHKSTEATN